MATPEQRNSWGKEAGCASRDIKPLYSFLLDQTDVLDCMMLSVRMAFWYQAIKCNQHAEIVFSIKDKELTVVSPLQVTRAKRQVKLDPPKRGKSGRSGAFSVLVSHFISFIILHKNEEHLMNAQMSVCLPGRSSERRRGRQTQKKHIVPTSGRQSTDVTMLF